MKFEDYRLIFVATTLILILVVAYPSLSMVISFPTIPPERFSELYILGPKNIVEDYPSEVHIGEQYQVTINVNNNLGESAYYLIYVKFRNQHQPLPNMSSSTASPLSPLYEYRFVIADGENWRSPLTFTILEATHLTNSLLVRRISINDVAFHIDSLSTSSDNDGFYYQLFFELWLYDESSKDIKFHNRFVGIWLNIVE